MSRFFIKAQKNKDVWTVCVVDKDGRRTRNSVPSFCKNRMQAMEEARRMASTLNMPIYTEL
jgi:hypothetical protein